MNPQAKYPAAGGLLGGEGKWRYHTPTRGNNARPFSVGWPLLDPNHVEAAPHRRGLASKECITGRWEVMARKSSISQNYRERRVLARVSLLAFAGSVVGEFSQGPESEEPAWSPGSWLFGTPL